MLLKKQKLWKNSIIFFRFDFFMSENQPTVEEFLEQKVRVGKYFWTYLKLIITIIYWFKLFAILRTFPNFELFKKMTNTTLVQLSWIEFIQSLIEFKLKDKKSIINYFSCSHSSRSFQLGMINSYGGTSYILIFYYLMVYFCEICALVKRITPQQSRISHQLLSDILTSTKFLAVIYWFENLVIFELLLYKLISDVDAALTFFILYYAFHLIFLSINNPAHYEIWVIINNRIESLLPHLPMGNHLLNLYKILAGRVYNITRFIKSLMTD